MSAQRAIFPPQQQNEDWCKDGRTTILIQNRWGRFHVPAQVWVHRVTGTHVSTALDPSLDHSGFTPQALDALMELSSFAPFESAVRLAALFGLQITRSHLERLTTPFAAQTQLSFRARLEYLAEQPLDHGPAAASRVMVIQTDGVYVQGRRPRRAKGSTSGSSTATPRADTAGTTSGTGVEIKTVVVYPQEAPSLRFGCAEVCTADELLPLLAGALRVAGMRQQDELIGVSDGAVWIEDKFRTLGVTKHVLDVFHSAAYLETVMLHLCWDDRQRETTRRAWFRGEIDGGRWLTSHLPDDQEWQGWPPDGLEAVRYLQRRTQMMAYPTYRERNWPIGSGQIEGMNKSVIGGRMKSSGMRWSRPGAHRMAALRASRTTRIRCLDFDQLRFLAFPSPAQ